MKYNDNAETSVKNNREKKRRISKQGKKYFSFYSIVFG